MRYDCVLLQKEPETGISVKEIQMCLEKLGVSRDDCVQPIAVVGGCQADVFGFLRQEAADMVCFDEPAFLEAVDEVVNDQDKEHPNGEYTFADIITYMYPTK